MNPIDSAGQEHWTFGDLRTRRCGFCAHFHASPHYAHHGECERDMGILRHEDSECIFEPVARGEL